MRSNRVDDEANELFEDEPVGTEGVAKRNFIATGDVDR